jgi:hypothetical protein
MDTRIVSPQELEAGATSDGTLLITIITPEDLRDGMKLLRTLIVSAKLAGYDIDAASVDFARAEHIAGQLLHAIGLPS